MRNCNNPTRVEISDATGNELLTQGSGTIVIVLVLFKYLRVFFFPRLTYNLDFHILDYTIVFVSHHNILLGRGVEGTSSYRDCSYAKS